MGRSAIFLAKFQPTGEHYLHFVPNTRQPKRVGAISGPLSAADVENLIADRVDPRRYEYSESGVDWANAAGRFDWFWVRRWDL